LPVVRWILKKWKSLGFLTLWRGSFCCIGQSDCRPGNRDLPVLEGLTQQIENMAPELDTLELEKEIESPFDWFYLKKENCDLESPYTFEGRENGATAADRI
jgi:hypothetical protein